MMYMTLGAFSVDAWDKEKIKLLREQQATGTGFIALEITQYICWQ